MNIFKISIALNNKISEPIFNFILLIIAFCIAGFLYAKQKICLNLKIPDSMNIQIPGQLSILYLSFFFGWCHFFFGSIIKQVEKYFQFFFIYLHFFKGTLSQIKKLIYSSFFFSFSTFTIYFQILIDLFIYAFIISFFFLFFNSN